MLVSTTYQHESPLPMSPPTWVLAFKNSLSPDAFWGQSDPPLRFTLTIPTVIGISFNCHHTYGLPPTIQHYTTLHICTML